MIKLYGIIILVAILGGVGYGAKYYYDTTQNTIAQLRENNAKLETANQLNQETIAKQQKDAIQLAELNNQLTVDLQKAEQYGDELRATLNKHDLTHLANKKPGLIERRMQNATDKLWDDLESLTSNSTTSD
jgi:phage host-nuclease inhibitor protein Gam